LASAAAPSRSVRTILRLEARARRLLTRYERALTAATQAKGQAHVLLDEADGLERALRGDQVRELHHARAQAAAGATPATDGGSA
jgi:hypothetical protein